MTTTLAAAASLALLACGPKPTDTHPIAGGAESQRLALEEAVRAAEDVWSSPTFWDLVAQRTWLPGPGQAPISGATVRAALEPHSPAAQKYRLVAFFGRRIYTLVYTSANAETAPGRPIDILRRRVPNPTLLDTVAHENTHLVTAPDGKARFIDGDYTAHELPWLVSYGIGDLAQCFASSGGDPVRTIQCFDQMVNAEPACRIEQQCFLPGAPAHILAARAAAPQCAAACATTIRDECDWAHLPRSR